MIRRFRGTGPDDVKAGLWRVCGQTNFGFYACGEYICNQLGGGLTRSCDKIQAARAFVTIACILSGIAALCLLAQLVDSIGDNRLIGLISKFLPLTSLIAGVIGFAVGVAFILGDFKLTFGAAAILAVVALVTNLIGMILAAISPSGRAS